MAFSLLFFFAGLFWERTSGKSKENASFDHEMWIVVGWRPLSSALSPHAKWLP
jgi:hypothetical protein